MKHQSCSDIAQELPFLLHGELSEKEKQLVLNHLSGCLNCQSAYEKLHKTFELAQSGRREPENFDAFNQALFHRIRQNRPNQVFILRPSRTILRPAVLVPVVSLCLILLAVGLWQRSQESTTLARKDPSTELALLDALEEQVPEVEEGNVTEEALLLDEMLLAEAAPPAQEIEILKELDLLEQLGEEEDLNSGQKGDDLEEELLSVDEEVAS